MKLFKYLYEGWLVWFVFSLLGSIGYIGYAFFASLASNDPSALAWLPFLPFIFPYILAYCLLFSGAVMAVYKFIYFILKRYF
jgi:hypothetical protein